MVKQKNTTIFVIMTATIIISLGIIGIISSCSVSQTRVLAQKSTNGTMSVTMELKKNTDISKGDSGYYTISKLTSNATGLEKIMATGGGLASSTDFVITAPDRISVDLTYKMPEAINTKKFSIEKANISLTVNSIEDKGSNKRIYFAKSEDQSQYIGNFNVISGVLQDLTGQKATLTLVVVPS